MKLFISISISALFLLIDLVCGNLGLVTATVSFSAICLTLAYGSRYGITAAIVAGIITDSLYGRSFSGTAFIYAIAVPAAYAVIIRGHRQLPAVFAGGTLNAFTVAAGSIILAKLSGAALPGPDVPSIIFAALGSGGLFLVLLVISFDFLASRADLPRCIKSELSTVPRGRRLVPRNRIARPGARRSYR